MFTTEMESIVFMFIPYKTETHSEARLMVDLFVDEMIKQYPSAKKVAEFDEDIVEEEFNKVIFRQIQVDGKKLLLIIAGEIDETSGASMITLTSKLPQEMTPEEFFAFFN
jgi:hypothetical protein